MNSGFILTKQVKDVANALQITLWVKTQFEIFKLVINNELALFFIESSYTSYAIQLLEKHNIYHTG